MDTSLIISIISILISAALVVVTIVYSNLNERMELTRCYFEFMRNSQYVGLIHRIVACKNDIGLTRSLLNIDVDLLNTMMAELEALLILFKKSSHYNNILYYAVFKNICENDLVCSTIDQMNSEGNNIFKYVQKRISAAKKRKNWGTK